MTETVVDPFEVVDVDQHCGQRLILASGERDQAIQPVVEVAVIGQAGQLIGRGLRREQLHLGARGRDLLEP